MQSAHQCVVNNVCLYAYMYVSVCYRMCSVTMCIGVGVCMQVVYIRLVVIVFVIVINY